MQRQAISMYEEIEILVLISPGSFTITWLKLYCIISCPCLCRDSPGKDDIQPVWQPVVTKNATGQGQWCKLILVTLISVDSHQFPAKILYFPKGNSLVYCSNYDRRYYRLRHKIPPLEKEEYREHSCALTDPEAISTRSLTPKGKY